MNSILMVDSSLLLWPIYGSLSQTFFHTFHQYKNTKDGFWEKNALSENKTRQNAEGSGIFIKYILSNDFLQIFLALKQFDPYMMILVWIRYNSINLDIGCYMLVKLTILKIMSLHFWKNGVWFIRAPCKRLVQAILTEIMLWLVA